MIELKENELVFRFPEVHPRAVCRIHFERTLRIPDDNRAYPLPPGLGSFPLRQVDDHLERVPESWRKHGGVFLPMYQAEAMWVCFDGEYPMAIKVAAGKIDAVTGRNWKNELSPKRQNYIVVPDQPWLDGFSVGKGLIRQFVAMPLGEGFTAEEQITGEGKHGGVQVVVYPMKASRYEEWKRVPRSEVMAYAAPQSAEMGLAPGGLMRQEIYEDEHGFDTWDRSVRSRCFVHVLNSAQFLEVAGAAPPTKPPTAVDYTRAGLPWFDYYDADRAVLAGSKKLAGLDSLAAKQLKKGKGLFPDNAPVEPTVVRKIGAVQVREGEF